jgi:hypothetical protein
LIQPSSQHFTNYTATVIKVVVTALWRDGIITGFEGLETVKIGRFVVEVSIPKAAIPSKNRASNSSA